MANSKKALDENGVLYLWGKVWNRFLLLETF